MRKASLRIPENTALHIHRTDSLTDMEQRYIRQTILPEFEPGTQRKLEQAAVLVVGAGALGCACLTYLAAAGIGHIGIVDNDTVSLSNLHRQVLYTESDLGLKKAAVAAQRLKAQNSDLKVTIFEERLCTDNARRIAANYDIIVDGTDNFPTRYLISDLCVFTGKTNVHASILGFRGSVAVFNAPDGKGGRTADYRDLYPHPPRPEDTQNCAEAGVIGALPGILGSMQALEVIKLAGEFGDPLTNRVFTIDTLNYRTFILNIAKDPENPLSGETPRIHDLINYSEFCGLKYEENMKTKTVQDLKNWMDSDQDFQLIDVREDYEYEEANLGGKHIPLGEIPQRFAEIDREKPVIVQCRSGQRSANAIMFLEQNQGFTNLYNLEGGILAWMEQIGELPA